MTFWNKCILSTAVAATLIATLPANAGDRRWHHRDYGRHDRGGDAVVAGIAGLTLGALVVGALASNRDEPIHGNPYRHPRPSPNRDFMLDDLDQVVSEDDRYEPMYEPWSRGWYRYCQQRYRSFDPDSGTFLGRDGREHFCAAD